MGVSKTLTTMAQDVINQTNSTKSDRQKIIVSWLEVNETKTESDPVIDISSKDFWKIFGPLLEQSAK
jgi:hypothetical protein